MGIKKFAQNIRKSVSEDFERRKKLNRQITQIRREGAEERILAVEKERVKVRKQRALEDVRGTPSKRGSTGAGKAFQSFQDFATNFSRGPSPFGTGMGVAEPKPVKKPMKSTIKRKMKKRRGRR